ncbi:MAG: LysM peptidoglycan-binding domain-containing protein [Eubacterium sp.]|nr:LysM peptidoglycan-binding domain-containing protein [Eubacterium sp.]
MRISLKSADGNKFVFALMPETIHAGYAAKCQSFDLISQGTVRVPKGTEVPEISWNGEFFGASRRKLAGIDQDNWQNPNDCVRILRDWMNKKTELTLIISGTWINMEVKIISFKTELHGGYGDVSYSIVFEKVRDLKIFNTKESKIGKKKKIKPRTNTLYQIIPSERVRTYTVKKGDTLIGIARRKDTTWQKLYNKNKAVIEKTARKHGKANSDHGHWIWPGTKLVIP